MPVLSDADALYVGTNEVDGVYLGSTEVWSGMDADAAAFISAAGISDSTQRAAVSALVVSLKAGGIWTKLHAIYPFVGGSASTHKYNLKDPRDLDAAFRLVYTGSPTHSSTGFLPNLAGGYADTKFVPRSHLPTESFSLAYYSRSQTADGDKTEIGNYNWSDGPGHRAHLLIRYGGNLFYYGALETGATSLSGSTDSRGLFAASRLDGSALKAYKNGALLATSTTPVSAQPNNSSWIGGINTYTAFTDRECAFAAIGEGLTDDENADLYTAVQAFQTTMGRNV